MKNTKEHKKRRKWPWILLIVLLILTIGITLLVKWQWNNLMALHYASNYSAEELKVMHEENEQVILGILEQHSDVHISDLPEEAVELLQAGELTEETAVAILTGKITWEDYQTQEAPVKDTGNDASVSRVDEIIAQIYVLRSGYVGKLDALVVQAWSEYRSGSISKADLISKYVGIGYSLEDECDGKMETLLSQLSQELSRTGGDLSLVDTIRHTYQSEKSIKKAELIAKYQN